MAVLRWGRAGTDTVAPVLRWGRAGTDGTAGSVPKLRWGRAGMTGVGATVLEIIPPQTVEPETIVTVSAPLVGGGFADSYTWRIVSGVPVSFTTVSTGVRTFRAPSVMPPSTAQTVIGVVGVVSGTSTPEVFVTITLLPQLRWYYTPTGWAGQRPPVQLV